MLSKSQFIEEEQDCVSMLGITLKEYRQDLKSTKVHNTKKSSTKNMIILFYIN